MSFIWQFLFPLKTSFLDGLSYTHDRSLLFFFVHCFLQHQYGSLLIFFLCSHFNCINPSLIPPLLFYISQVHFTKSQFCNLISVVYYVLVTGAVSDGHNSSLFMLSAKELLLVMLQFSCFMFHSCVFHINVYCLIMTLLLH